MKSTPKTTSKTAQQIYEAYKIMPTLQLHQLRVASVAKAICENFNEKSVTKKLDVGLDTDSVILACLFHDMGNIIKSDLERFPDFTKPEGLEYWQNVKKEFVEKYGAEEHHATEIIAGEIGLPTGALALLKRIGFSNLDKTDAEGSFENKICSYADMRVGPFGVIPIEERLTEGRKRYAGRKHSIASERFDSLANNIRNIEKDIFASTKIQPEDIDDERVKQDVEALRSYSF